MISEERVKELYHLSVFDEYENKKYHQAGEYTMWDYVGKEVVKSFFSGTIAFVLMIVFWGLGDIDTITKWINRVDFATFLPKLRIYWVYDCIYPDYHTDLLCPLCRRVSQDEIVRKSSEESAQITERRKIKNGA